MRGVLRSFGGSLHARRRANAGFAGENVEHAQALWPPHRRIDDLRRPGEFHARRVVTAAHPEPAQARRARADAGFAAIARTMARRLQR
ncbi:hypothetical protein FCJ61_18250 [Burkholderia metallica]|uniref:hypothetical protein n=1 Tax=Burkholderia metallica TaxID=488729 RepID=UPI00157BAC7E|nr:hypothetical protein [Burkholderia metallica]NTZ84890.1 hypothetical protein [Burkholderia metallica]